MEALIEKIKNILWITDATYDDYLGAVVPLLLEFAEDECNVKWRNSDGEPENIPGRLVIFIARAAEYILVQAGLEIENLGDWGAHYTTDFPDSIMRFLPGRRLKW